MHGHTPNGRHEFLTHRNRKMKIAFIVASLGRFGPVVVVRSLVRQLTAMGHKCRVFYFDEGEAMDFACPTQRISFWKSFDMSAFDIVQTNSFRPNLWAYIHKQPRDVKYVTTMHSYIREDFYYQFGRHRGPWLSKLFVFSARRHDAVVAQSEDMKQYYAKLLPKRYISVISNGLTLTETELNTPIPEKDLAKIQQFKGDSTLLGAFCNLGKIKNITLCLKAMQRLPERYRLLIIGDGCEKPNLEREAIELGINERVLFIGQRPEASPYLPLIDVFLLTSFSEGCPLAMFEAATYSKPMVCSDIRGMRERFDETEVTYFPSNDLDALCRAIEQATETPEKGLRFNEKLQKTFTERQMAQHYVDLFEQLMNTTK